MSYPSLTYLGDHGEFSASFRATDVAPELALGTKTMVSYLATGATTEGRFGFYRWDMAPTPPSDNLPGGHFHRTFAESFFILDGTVTLYNGRTWIQATPGSFYYVPPGGIHGFSNNSGAAASMLLLFAPGAPREGYFEEIAAIVATGRDVTRQEWADLFARYDQYEVES
ncbi:cupin [Rhizocola hellebori]|uniref:Cupin n=1 Tax=Rhizocola hellebori TaxID=1392758 RepID=A0A8J3Q739_9ACTN|nr:cupin domain-containing protein [Rhizocola hellebori]GIH05189.1 cupin [Rhizocola hellebori]